MLDPSIIHDGITAERLFHAYIVLFRCWAVFMLAVLAFDEYKAWGAKRP